MDRVAICLRRMDLPGLFACVTISRLGYSSLTYIRNLLQHPVISVYFAPHGGKWRLIMSRFVRELVLEFNLICVINFMEQL